MAKILRHKTHQNRKRACLKKKRISLLLLGNLHLRPPRNLVLDYSAVSQLAKVYSAIRSQQRVDFSVSQRKAQCLEENLSRISLPVFLANRSLQVAFLTRSQLILNHSLVNQSLQEDFLAVTRNQLMLNLQVISLESKSLQEVSSVATKNQLMPSLQAVSLAKSLSQAFSAEQQRLRVNLQTFSQLLSLQIRNLPVSSIMETVCLAIKRPKATFSLSISQRRTRVTFLVLLQRPMARSPSKMNPLVLAFSALNLQRTPDLVETSLLAQVSSARVISQVVVCLACQPSNQVNQCSISHPFSKLANLPPTMTTTKVLKLRMRLLSTLRAATQKLSSRKVLKFRNLHTLVLSK